MSQKLTAGKRRAPWVIRLPLPILVLITVVAVTSCAYRLHLGQQIEHQVRAIKDRGELTSFANADSLYPDVPLHDNAALVFSLGFSKLRATNATTINEFRKRLTKADPSGALDDATRRQIRSWLRENSEALALFQRAALLPASRYPISLKKGGAVELPHLNQFPLAGNLLFLQGVLAVDTNSAHAAQRSVSELMALGQSLSAEPTLWSQDIRWWCQRTAVDLLSRIVNNCPISDDSLRELQLSLRQAESSPSLVRAFQLERCSGLNVSHRKLFRSMPGANYSLDPFSAALAHFTLSVAGRIEADRLFFLETTAGYIAALGEPFPARLRMARSLQISELAGKRFLYLSASFCGTYERTIPHQAHTVATLRTAQMCLAIERFRRANERLPRTPAELVPGYLTSALHDPFDGQELRFAAQGESYSVYSVGENIKDDCARAEGNLDLVIAVSRREPEIHARR